MSAHTPGRVTVHENGDANSYTLLGADGRWLVHLLHTGEAWLDQQRANMRRLAALWNACDGIPTDIIERHEFRSAALVARTQIDNADRREHLGEEYRAGLDGPPED